MFQSEKNIVFLFDEWDFARFHFCSFDIKSLEADLQTLEWSPITVADWISKEGPSPVDTLLIKAGFHRHAIYDRIICRKVMTSTRLEESPELANTGDVNAIHYLLLRAFDKYAEHIISVEELHDFILRKQVIVSRDSQSAINGFVIFPTRGRSCHFNYLYNSGGPERLAYLLKAFYRALSEQGVAFAFGWVRRTKIRVLRLHQSFGWKTDGLVDYIYLR